MNGEQVAEAQSIAPVVTVQNWYNVAHRGDEELITSLDKQGISYVAFWPLGGFSPLQSGVLDQVAESLGTSPKAVAIAWRCCTAPRTSWSSPAPPRWPTSGRTSPPPAWHSPRTP